MARFKKRKYGLSGTKKSTRPDALKQGYKDSNLEMTESESVALPFGDSPSFTCKSYYIAR